MKVSTLSTIIELKSPIRLTEKKMLFMDRLMNPLTSNIKDVSLIKDVTPWGNILYAGKGTPYIRFEVDNRHITTEEGISIIEQVLEQIKSEFSRNK